MLLIGLHYRFGGVPGFAKVALKSIQDDYTRSISIDDCASAILRAPHSEVQDCVEDIKKHSKPSGHSGQKAYIEALLICCRVDQGGKPCSCKHLFQRPDGKHPSGRSK
jgi:hypothetical protein